LKFIDWIYKSALTPDQLPWNF